jgi:23S rRNA (guanine745-N1)-methyltransferase
VRGCGLPLVGQGTALVCSAGHAFDVARAGYVNLLQPQDRRSAQAGDTREAIEARSALLSRGVGGELARQIIAEARGRMPFPDGPLLDLGAGTGDLLAGLADATGRSGIGIDLSTVAMEQAARRHPALTWVVANADRRLPIRDRSISLIVSMHGRRNPSESARVLAAEGALFVIVPGPRDLHELRSAIGGQSIEHDRVPGVETEHERHFRLVTRRTLEEHHRLDPSILRLLLHGTYRGVRRSAAGKVDSLETLDVTLASELLVFAAR